MPLAGWSRVKANSNAPRPTPVIQCRPIMFFEDRQASSL